MKLVLIGIPGSGKSTQGNLLSAQLDIPYLSTGHIFRQLSQEKSQLGHYVKATISSGLLIPDDKTIEIVKSYLEKPEYKKGYIIDGFPRTVTQAKQFKNTFDKAIYLEIPDKEVLWRLAYRGDALRTDDTITTIKKRIEIFHKNTEPVIHFFKRLRKLEIVDGSKSIKEVNKQILQRLGMKLIHNKIRVFKSRKKTIIAFVGLPGSGKTEAASYLAKKGLPVVSFGRRVDEYVEILGLPHDNQSHKKARNEIRQEHGMEALAKLNEKEIEVALQKQRFVIIDGLRSWAEYEFLKKKFNYTSIVLVALHCDKKSRYRRINNRKKNSKLLGEERDIGELLDTQMGATIAYADFIIDNTGALPALKTKLDTLYRELYYS